jgi:chromate reductase
LEIFDLEGIPAYNQDLEDNHLPIITELKNKIRAADALLMVTPEYNHSFSGVLKNAIDWASRPPTDNVFQGKPVAVMSASTGLVGGPRAQAALRQSFVFLDMHPVNKPEVFVTQAAAKFDETGRLTDEKARELIKDLLRALTNWARKIK